MIGWGHWIGKIHGLELFEIFYCSPEYQTYIMTDGFDIHIGKHDYLTTAMEHCGSFYE
jgi:hypothetical protein